MLEDVFSVIRGRLVDLAIVQSSIFSMEYVKMNWRKCRETDIKKMRKCRETV